MAATMKAIIQNKYGGPEELKYESDVPRPVPGPDEVLVHVKAAGVNPVDILVSEGGFGKEELPFIPGSDFAGVIEEVGTEVTGSVKKGDRVYGFGTVRPDAHTYAEYVTVKYNFVHPLPETLSFSQGAGIPVPYYTAYRVLYHTANAKPGEVVLVHGASGGTGIAATQIARSLGLTVIGTAGTTEGAELVKKAGAHYVFNHREEGYEEKIKKAAGEKGVNIVVEMVANKNLNKDIDLVGKQGHIVVIGGAGNISTAPITLLFKQVSITGAYTYNITEEELYETSRALHAGIETGWLRPFIWKELPLEKASEAYRLIRSGTGARGKIVLLTE